METALQDRDRVGVQDAVLLEDFTNQDVFVDNLQKRFKEGLIYTYIGPVLITINPYKNLGVYDKEHVKFYEKKLFFETPPHVFALTDTAYRSLIEETKEQCILISGESGAGKTEASKHVLQYLAEITEGPGNAKTVKDKLLQSNPVLEAFGNATTNRNDNSSRFGKYMDVEFDFQGQPIGGNIINYLLEKSRVINQVKGERNFHIFYQLLTGTTDSELDELYLKRSADSYYYLSNGEKAQPSSNKDKTDFNEVTKALKVIEFTNEEKDEIFKIVASVLHLGNVGFVEEEGAAKVHKCESLEFIAKLLGCKEEELERALTIRTRDARGDIVASPLDRETAVYARDALAKAIYDRMFTWLVGRINTSIQSPSKKKNPVIGILDIYGFEIFEKNNFEQLCINFCNEKLQQLFIELTLKQEQEEYLREGIEWQNIEYFDNKVICDLVEEKHKGIISLMDEECLRPGDATDLTLLAKLNDALEDHKHYRSHRKVDAKTQKTLGRDEFQLIHYAGTVTYNVKSFIEKNNDLLFRDLRNVMASSKNNIIVTSFPPTDRESMRRPDTAITQFKNSLNRLVVLLRSKEPNYIRCIKPNEHKQKDNFNNKLVSDQVQYLGLMENLRVRRAGFAYRRTYERFLQRYKSLCTETWPNYHGEAKEGVQKLACALGYEKEEYRMGKTKIFIRHPKTLFDTEDAFQRKKHVLISLIQARWKRILQRRKYLKIRAQIIVMQTWIRRRLAQNEAARLRAAILHIKNFLRGYVTRTKEPNEYNRRFIAIARKLWLIRLSQNLPKKLLDDSWPPCQPNCQSASDILKKMHKLHRARVFRLSLSPELKRQLELKVLAEKLFLFNAKKKNYKVTITQWFKSERIPNELDQSYVNFVKTLVGEKVCYGSTTVKYDRHGYKPRDRVLVVTTHNIYILEFKSNALKLKHKIAFNKISLLVTSEKDKMLLIQLPEELLKSDKGDLILEIPHIIECVTQIVAVQNKLSMLKVIDEKAFQHQMEKGKQGTIDVTIGNPEGFQKATNGHLLITASP